MQHRPCLTVDSVQRGWIGPTSYRKKKWLNLSFIISPSLVVINVECKIWTFSINHCLEALQFSRALTYWRREVTFSIIFFYSGLTFITYPGVAVYPLIRIKAVSVQLYVRVFQLWVQILTWVCGKCYGWPSCRICTEAELNWSYTGV